jgi:nicotinamide mononucleotide adenylyltransferase
VLSAGEWRHWDAVVPMRTQPLHVNHVRLIRAFADVFNSVRVVVGNQPRSSRDPYPYERRRAWWQRAVDVHGIERVEFVRGAHGRDDETRVAVYRSGLCSTHTVLVTGNQEVERFWHDRCMPVLYLGNVPPLPAVGYDSRLARREGTSTLIREAFTSATGLEEVRPLLPEWVWDDLSGRLSPRGGGRCDRS